MLIPDDEDMLPTIDEKDLLTPDELAPEDLLLEVDDDWNMFDDMDNDMIFFDNSWPTIDDQYNEDDDNFEFNPIIDGSDAAYDTIEADEIDEDLYGGDLLFQQMELSRLQEEKE